MNINLTLGSVWSRWDLAIMWTSDLPVKLPTCKWTGANDMCVSSCSHTQNMFSENSSRRIPTDGEGERDEVGNSTTK